MRHDFCAFILSHGRPNRVLTYDTLINDGYTGNIRIIVDNEDSTVEQYRARFGDKVVVFNKKDEASRTDRCDNFPKLNTVLFARNACWQIARDLGYRYFVQLDDDYTGFCVRYEANGESKGRESHNIDGLFLPLLEYYESIPALSIAFAQTGDFMGGVGNGFMTSLRRRKAMNSFFCSVDRPFRFVARMNDDVSTYVSLGAVGGLFMTVPLVSLRQATTQTNSGGLTEMYLELGTYVKSFYTVMVAPSCTKVYSMGESHRRMHHSISWINAVPQIIREKYRKDGE